MNKSYAFIFLMEKIFMPVISAPQEKIQFLFFPFIFGTLSVFLGSIVGFFGGGFLGSHLPDPSLGWFMGLFLGLFTGIPLGWISGIFISWKIGNILSSTPSDFTKRKVISLTDFLVRTWGLVCGMTLGMFLNIWLEQFFKKGQDPSSAEVSFIYWWFSIVGGGLLGRYSGKILGSHLIFLFFRLTEKKLPLDRRETLWESFGIVFMAFVGALSGVIVGDMEIQISNSFFGIPLGIFMAQKIYRKQYRWKICRISNPSLSETTAKEDN